MLVKHNHSGLNIENIFAKSRQTKHYEIKYKNNTISFKGISKPDTPVVFGYFYQEYKDYYSKFVIKNVGNAVVNIESIYQNNLLKGTLNLLPGEYVEISRKNFADGHCTWINIVNLEDFNELHAIKIIDFMITKDGYSDVYLPNINTLPQDKQPLLPPEGDYKEIEPMRG